MDSKIAGQILDYIETAAPPIQLSSITQDQAARRQSGRSGSIWQMKPRRAVTVAAAAAAIAAAVTIGIRQADSSPTRTSNAAVLTAAVVHRIVAASEAATAPAGHILVTFSLGPMHHSPSSSGSINFTFSRRNFNAIDRLAASPIDRKSQTLTVRRVNGQIYTFGGPGRPQQWYRLGKQLAAGRAVPDPRKVLTALRPEAAFKDIGSQRVGGVQTRILKATKLGKLPASVLSPLTFVSSMGPQSLAAFKVWVDSHDVVRQMQIVYYDQSPQGRLIDIQMIRFLDIGKPEKITAPRHYVNQRTSS